MNYKTDGKRIIISIAAFNDGKFRFKKRENRFSFGNTFSTRKDHFDDKTYLEWQIGYDVPVADFKKKIKNTKLNKKKFTGSNGKEKYPYELSEFFYEALKIRLISKEQTRYLLEEISSYENYIDEKPITIERESRVNLNGINFEGLSIKLPTLIMTQTSDETQIEISIQKQQYASGTQPMVYFCIPVKAFDNYNSLELKDRSSVPDDVLEYIINGENAAILLDMMKVFAMASKRHNHDIRKIIEILLKLINKV